MFTGEPFWNTNRSPEPRFSALADDVEVDVAVVGAGIAGMSTAWELARSGRDVAVLESDQVGLGVTGHTTAKVSALHGARYRQLIARLGESAASAYAHSQALAMHHVEDVVELLGIDCDLERRPAYLFSEDPADIEALREEAEAAHRCGLSAQFTTDAGLPFPCSGAVRVDGQLMFHPLKYLDALAADVIDHGGTIPRADNGDRPQRG